MLPTIVIESIGAGTLIVSLTSVAVGLRRRGEPIRMGNPSSRERDVVERKDRRGGRTFVRFFGKLPQEESGLCKFLLVKSTVHGHRYSPHQSGHGHSTRPQSTCRVRPPPRLECGLQSESPASPNTLPTSARTFRSPD